MNRQRLFSMICYLFILSLLMINGCSKSILPIDKNEPLPPIIKVYKHTAIVSGRDGMRNTGVFIDEGDTYTIMATGSIDLCPGRTCGYNNIKPEDGWPIMAKIGKERARFSPIPLGYNYNTEKSWDSGYLFLGYKAGGTVDIHGNSSRPEWKKDDFGAFSVDIIVWKKEDYVQIAAFLEKMKARDPNNKVILDALEYANRVKDIRLAEAKASKEVDETKKMIQELKGDLQQKEQDIETDTDKKPIIQPKLSTGEMVNEKKIEELEKKLAEQIKMLCWRKKKRRRHSSPRNLRKRMNEKESC